MLNKEVYTSALETFGAYTQTMMVFEEMAELQKELCKDLRGEDRIDQIAEEIADVSIMLDQMMLLHNCEASVAEVKSLKVDRLRRTVDKRRRGIR